MPRRRGNKRAGLPLQPDDGSQAPHGVEWDVVDQPGGEWRSIIDHAFAPAPAPAKAKTSSIDSKFPIEIPYDRALTSTEDFELELAATTPLPFAESLSWSSEGDSTTSPWDVAGLPERSIESDMEMKTDTLDEPAVAQGDPVDVHDEPVHVPDEPVAAQDDPMDVHHEPVKGHDKPVNESDPPSNPSSKFIDGLKAFQKPQWSPEEDWTNKMTTENNDKAYRSTKNPLVDLFFELEDVVSGPRLKDLLTNAWAHDKDVTLKIIFNARSIHLGKSSRTCFYRACGWLAVQHPRTLLVNLKWLCEPVIEKPKPTKDLKGPKSGDDFDMILETDLDADANKKSWAKKHGLAHGYWKDLLNLLVLAVNGELSVYGNPSKVLNVQSEKLKRKREWNKDIAKEARDARRKDRHDRAVSKFKEDAFYRLLHLTVARLFAKRLETDLALLKSDSKQDKMNISLAAKWAPTLGGFHDQHCFVTTSIAEVLKPDIVSITDQSREFYLKLAREHYRSQVLSPLRKHLEVVERDITAKTYDQIKYERLPSLAMQRYSRLFIEKDAERFDKFLDALDEGNANISGAVLLPSTLVASISGRLASNRVKRASNRIDRLRETRMLAKVANGQWKALVQRVKASGTLWSAIAVCDVSGSMSHPTFPDGTCPMDSAIGLSLLLAEVTQPPFGGHFITFSSKPELVKTSWEGESTFDEKVKRLTSSEWGMNTDFEAVFLKLILPMAVEQKIKQEDMVKTIFVFSDMQFDAAKSHDFYSARAGLPRDDWSTSYERISTAYKIAGYEVPHLVFWNLAGGRDGYEQYNQWETDSPAPKPVTADTPGCSMVSGYSQGQMKVFLDGAGFSDVKRLQNADDDEEEVTTEDKEDEGENGADDADEGFVEVKMAEKKSNSLDTVMRAIGHEAYSMLKVVD